MEKIKVNSIEQAEQFLQYAREACLKGNVDYAIELMVEITAFYERSKIKGRIKACQETLDQLLKIEDLDYHQAFEILDNLALAPCEQAQLALQRA